MIVIVDYGLGNLRSVYNRFRQIGYEPFVTSDIKHIERAERLILPGVGHFSKGMENLTRLGLLDILKHRVLVDKVPILGICLGMQLLGTWSEEGDVSGLGLIDARTEKFRFDTKISGLKIPHIGWNSIEVENDSLLLNDLDVTDSLFYFVHSYHVRCNSLSDVVASSEYGCRFHSIVQKENIFGTQFHPEKSHENGAILLANFLNYV